LIDIRAMAFMEFAFLSIRHFIAFNQSYEKKTNENHIPYEFSKLPTKALCLDFFSCFGKFTKINSM